MATENETSEPPIAQQDSSSASTPRQLFQSVKTGELHLVETPIPSPAPTEVLVATSCSAVSPGTERAVNDLASSSLLQKARARPDLVRQVVTKARTDGIQRTVGAVRTRLDEMMPLGYSAAGVAMEVGEYVPGIRPGMRVATGGAGHGDYQLVPGLLTVPIPDRVSDEDASLATVASIALHGLRLAELGPGARVCVIGLGLVGQITCRLAQAAGLIVAGIDLKSYAVDAAIESGNYALIEEGAQTTRSIMDWTKGRGVDAVLITAATKSSGPVDRATEIARDRAPIVVVGDVGLELDRRPFYEKELTLKVARSYGPGRYERLYEDWGVDYPAGQVRWTEGRNLEAVLDLLATGRLDFSGLITHRFAFGEVRSAYDLIKGEKPFLGVQLQYPTQPIRRRQSVQSHAQGDQDIGSSTPSRPSIGIIGAGGFVRSTLLQALRSTNVGEVDAICSSGGASARFMADKYGIPSIATDATDLIEDPTIDLIAIATPHDTHAALVVKTLESGKHVFCEKPLALNLEELDRIEDAWQSSGKVLQVGFNRRFAPSAVKAKELLGSDGGPLVITYRVNAGELPESHWYHDQRFGGRLIGEACHFIDLCSFLVGHDPAQHCTLAGNQNQSITEDNFGILLSYPDGSVAAITYGSAGHGSMPKESVEIVGRGRALTINDFNRLVVDGKRVSVKAGRGHSQQFASLGQRVREGKPFALGISSSRIAIECVQSIGVNRC